MSNYSIRGIRRKILKYQEKGKKVPLGLIKALDKAKEEQQDTWGNRRGLAPENPLEPPSTRKRAKPVYGYLPGTFGAASKGRSLSDGELAARKAELEQDSNK